MTFINNEPSPIPASKILRAAFSLEIDLITLEISLATTFFSFEVVTNYKYVRRSSKNLESDI